LREGTTAEQQQQQQPATLVEIGNEENIIHGDSAHANSS
jgi:hypothetical protein